MSRPSSCKLGAVLLILIKLSACVHGEDQNKFSCIGNRNYTSNSTYEANLKSVISSLSSLSSLASDKGFYNASVGQGEDRVNALALCRVDRTLDQCRSCIRAGADAFIGKCPNWKKAIVWYEYCMLRYSDEVLYATLATDPAENWSNTEKVSNPEEFGATRTRLFDVVRAQTANGGAEIKIGAGSGNVSATQTIYGMMQCTPDLTRDECDDCLKKAAADYMVCCDGALGARTLVPSCNLRYELYHFYNETRLRELKVSPLSLPSPPVASPRPGSNDNNTSPSTGKKDDNNSKSTIIIVVVAGATLLFVVCAIFFIRKRLRWKTKYIPQATDEEDTLTAESLQYDFGRIRDATNNFADPNKLGEGGFGAVYHGNLRVGEEIAVKRLSKNSGQGIVEFMNEVMLLAKLQHRNLVRLLGFSTEGTERLLIYEFVPNASLDKFIFDPNKRSQLEWDKRYKIIGGIAKGLLYLHEDSRLKIVHRDLKASNILLDGDMNPKIADFGMARLFGQDETQANTSKIVGTYGYMSPEYAMHGQFSIKSDVFSFGVLVLEIISGQRNVYFQSGENVQDLLTFAWKNWQEGTSENVIDPTLLKNGTTYLRDILRCIHIGLLCVQENAANRPTVASIVLMLSSSTITLPRPSEPAFYMSTCFGPAVSFTQESNPESTSSKASNPNAANSQDSSRNDMSVSELYPR